MILSPYKFKACRDFFLAKNINVIQKFEEMTIKIIPFYKMNELKKLMAMLLFTLVFKLGRCAYANKKK